MSSAHSPLKMLRLLALLALFGVLGGCAATTEWQDPRDPLERFNRSIYTFNDTVDGLVLKPAAELYGAGMPDFANRGVTNFFGNLNDISVTVNDLLQFKLGQASSDGGRFLINTTVGVLGFIDVATGLGFPKHNEDFGQTLGAWGVGEGAYLVLPLLGPSSVRDALALIPEFYLDPVSWLNPDSHRLATRALDVVDTREGLLGASRVVDQAALDPYEFVRDGYFQKREYDIYDGNPPLEFEDEFLP